MRASLPAALVALALAGCSLTRPDVDDCRSTAECRAAFGFGFVCGGDGLCAGAPAEPRCAATWPVNLFANPAEGGRLVIATVVDTSLETHVARANAVQLAVQDASADSAGVEGGIDGRKFGLVTCTIAEDTTLDTLSRAEATLRVTRYIEGALDVPVVVGPPGSGEASAAFEATTRTLFISPSATSPALTALEPVPASDAAPGRLWRTAPTDVEQADRIASDLSSRGVRDVALLAQQGTYGDGLVALLTERIAGLQIERFETQGQLSAAVGVIADGGASEVIFASSATADAVSFLTAAAADAAFTGRRFFLTDAAANEDLLAGLPMDAGFRGRVRGTRAALDPVRAASFAARYRVAYGASDVDALSFTAHAYDAGWLALYALGWATLQEDRVDAVALGRGLRQLSSGVAVDVGELSWPVVLDAFRAGRSVDLRGASGALDYDPDTEERSEDGQSFEVWRVSSDGTAFCRVGDMGCS